MQPSDNVGCPIIDWLLYITEFIFKVSYICIMGSHTIKGADNSLYGEDHAQNPYSTGFPVEYIPQEIQWNMAIKISINKLTKGTYTRAFHFCTGQQNKKKM